MNVNFYFDHTLTSTWFMVDLIPSVSIFATSATELDKYARFEMVVSWLTLRLGIYITYR